MTKELLLWIGALVFFGIGDMVTTAIGLSTLRVVEANPVYADVSYSHMLFMKFFTFSVFYLAYRYVPKDIRLGMPLGLSVLGIVVTVWNSYVILSV